MKIKKFNESVENNLSFDEFKDIMSDITDDLITNYDFMEETSDDDCYYELSIDLKNIELGVNSITQLVTLLKGFFIPINDQMNISDDELILPVDSYDNGGEAVDEEEIEDCIRFVREKHINLLSKKDEIIDTITNIIEQKVAENEYLEIILNQYKNIYNRLKLYDNFKESRLSYDDTDRRVIITFEKLTDYEDKEI